MTNDLVSIITPNFNSAKFVAQTIASVSNQTYKHWEWIIVDDYSTDESVRLIKKHTDTRIKIICLKTNQGAAVARNIGIENAIGRYLTFIDSDDLWLPNFLEETLTFLKTNSAELVYTSYKRVDENLSPILSDFIGPDKVDYNRLLYNCPIPMLTAVYDTKRIGKVKIPLVDKREDYAMWLEVLKKIPVAYRIEKSLAIYRIRKGSYSRNKFIMGIKQFYVYYNYLNLNLPKSLFYTISWVLNGIIKYVR